MAARYWIAVVHKGMADTMATHGFAAFSHGKKSAVDKVEFMGRSAGGLRQSVTRSIFAQAYEIDKTLGNDQRWEMAPLNIAGHYSKLIFPMLREEGNARGLEKAWNNLIALEIAIMEPVEDEKRKSDFTTQRLPSLQWAKWADVADHGERARAANAMLQHVESNMDHDSVEGWIMELVQIVEGGTISEEELMAGDQTELPEPPPPPSTPETSETSG